jgi:CRISPR-associated endonuclease Csn1
MEYRLGLDVGTNSLGWAVIRLLDNVPQEIIAAGSRIFSEGRLPKTKTTLKASRTEKRSARRRRDRFLQRQAFLISEMTKAGIFPDDEAHRKQLELLDPYEIRYLALRQQIPIHNIGRALFHINQRRGFKSSRNDKSEESTSGVVSNSIRALLEQMHLLDPEMSADDKEKLSPAERKEMRIEEANNRKKALEILSSKKTLSFGAFLYSRHARGQTVRARRHEDKKLYDVYPTRELLADEFNKILVKQAEYYPSILTDTVINKLYDVIFFKRKLKPQEREVSAVFIRKN